MSAPVSALTMAVAHDALGDFFVNLVNLFASSDAGLPMGDLAGLLDGTSFGDGDYHIDSLDITGGRMLNSNFTITSIAPAAAGATDGTFAVTANLTGHAVYDQWHEQGEFTPPATGGAGSAPHDDPFDDTYSGFSFDITAMPMSLTVAIGTSSDSMDPDDTALVLKVTVTETSYQPASVANVNIPDGSAARVGDFFGVFSANAPAMMQQAMSDADMVGPFVDSINVMFQAIGDSGAITPDLHFLFPPMELDYPATGGFQMGVSGRFVTTEGDRYVATDPVALALPVVPDSGMVFSFNEYLINEAAWGASKTGALNVSFPLAGMPPQEWNTDALKSTFPSLWDFSPSAPFGITVTNDPDTSPRFSFMPAWQATSAVLAGLGVPASVSTALTAVTGTIYAAAADLTNVLNAELLPADFAAWSDKIVAASAGNGLGSVTPYEVALVLSQHGVKTSAVTFDVTLTHWIDGLGFTADAAQDKQAFTFSVDYQSSQVSNAAVAPGVTFDVALAESLFAEILAPQLDALTAQLQAVGALGVPLPTSKKFIFANPTLSISDSVIQIAGDTIAPS